MNYIKHLTAFFERIIQDSNLNPTHISLYIALFQHWNVNRFQNPISITRDEIMRISKICSKATYHKCMRELHDKGYVKYEPSFNPFRGSMVHLFNFSEDLKPVQKKAGSNQKNLSPVGQLVNKHQTGNESGNEQALVSSINNTNKTNISNDSNLGEQSQNFENDNISPKKEIPETSAGADKNQTETPTEKEMLFAFTNSDEKQTAEKGQKSSAKKENRQMKPPSSEEVQNYFAQKNFPELEAQKFFNYFSSNGWLVGGKTPMVDWTAAAQNWMLNADKFNSHEQQTNRAKQLNTSTDKDYSEPL